MRGDGARVGMLGLDSWSKCELICGSEYILSAKGDRSESISSTLYIDPVDSKINFHPGTILEFCELSIPFPGNVAIDSVTRNEKCERSVFSRLKNDCT